MTYVLAASSQEEKMYWMHVIAGTLELVSENEFTPRKNFYLIGWYVGVIRTMGETEVQSSSASQTEQQEVSAAPNMNPLPPISGTLGQCRVLYDYDAPSGDGYLTLRVGDVITIFEKDPSGWWLGELNGRTGWFSESFTEDISSRKPSGAITTTAAAAKAQELYAKQQVWYTLDLEYSFKIDVTNSFIYIISSASFNT